MKKIRLQLFAITLSALLVLVCVVAYSFDRVMRLSQEKQDIYLRNSLSQVAQGIGTVLDDVESSILNYAYSEEVQKLLQASALSPAMLKQYNAARNSASIILRINQNIEGIALLPVEQSYYYSFSLENCYRYIQAARGRIQASENREMRYNGLLGDQYGDNSAYFTFELPIYSAVQGRDAELGEYLGTCIAFCKKDALEEVMDAALLDGLSIELRSEAGCILSTERLQAGAQSQPITVNRYDLSGKSRWHIIQRSYGSPYSSPYLMVFGAAVLIAVIVLLLLTYIVHRNFTLPILRINRELQRIAQRPLEPAELDIDCGNELDSIAHSVNTLLLHLQESHNKQVEQQSHMLRAQLSVNQLQLALLQNQINPHFLYNTLACIRGIALSNGVRVIADIVTNMATLYRYSIKGGEYVQLRDELDIVRRYLEIMNLRMDNKFQLELEAPEALQDRWIAKMILQPLVENAIFHGLECREQGGLLRLYVSYFEQDSAFLFHVYDNGQGMDDATVRRLNDLFNQPVEEQNAAEMNAKGMGLLNVHRKIRLLQGEPYGLHVESAAGRYTRVSVLLPLLDQKPEGPGAQK